MSKKEVILVSMAVLLVAAICALGFMLFRKNTMFDSNELVSMNKVNIYQGDAVIEIKDFDKINQITDILKDIKARKALMKHSVDGHGAEFTLYSEDKEMRFTCFGDRFLYNDTLYISERKHVERLNTVIRELYEQRRAGEATYQRIWNDIDELVKSEQWKTMGYKEGVEALEELEKGCEVCSTEELLLLEIKDPRSSEIFAFDSYEACINKQKKTSALFAELYSRDDFVSVLADARENNLPIAEDDKTFAKMFLDALASVLDDEIGC